MKLIIPLRIYPNLVVGVEKALTQIFGEGYPADKVLANLFKAHPAWGSRDRAFVAETTYDLVRYVRRFEPRIGSGYQPKSWYDIIGRYLLFKGYPVRDIPDWNYLSRDYLYTENASRSIHESVTGWFDDKGAAFYGARWPDLLKALNEPAKVVLRVNTLKTTAQELLENLNEEGIKCILKTDSSLELVTRTNIFQTEAFKKGLFEVQDLASQQIAPALRIKPGQRIVDACAGAGGKTLHLAALAQNKGQIIALDTEPGKLQELKKRAKRAGAFNIEPRLIEGQKTIKRLFGSADRLLLDVPCTGTGVLRRNPDSKWRVNQAYLDHCLKMQTDILRQYTPICKPGGLIVYATCSILKEENQDQIQKFLAEHPDYTLLEEKQLLPDDFGYDGFYYAVLSAPKTPSVSENSPADPSDN
jgi:16S rRNA (cytosine967-C5)-methyltransferase